MLEEKKSLTSLTENNNISTPPRDSKTGKLTSTHDSETIMMSSTTKNPAPVPKDPEEEKIMTFTSSSPPDSKDEGKTAVSTVEREEFRERLLRSKMESDKTLKHLIEIKVDVSVLECVYYCTVIAIDMILA